MEGKGKELKVKIDNCNILGIKKYFSTRTGLEDKMTGGEGRVRVQPAEASPGDQPVHTGPPGTKD